jgi:membrane-associated HD superfamily phosphohydrolase
VLASTLRGSSNLRTDPNLSKQLIEEQLTKQVIPTIEVRKGDLITRKGEPISPQAYDVLDYFGRVRREPQPGIWFQHFIEALAACGVMVLVMRRERPCLEVRHALLAGGNFVPRASGEAVVSGKRESSRRVGSTHPRLG